MSHPASFLRHYGHQGILLVSIHIQENSELSREKKKKNHRDFIRGKNEGQE